MARKRKANHVYVSPSKRNKLRAQLGGFLPAGMVVTLANKILNKQLAKVKGQGRKSGHRRRRRRHH